MSDKKAPKNPPVYNYYVDESNKRIVRTTAQTKAIQHFYAPKVRIAKTDEVLAHMQAGLEIEKAA